MSLLILFLDQITKYWAEHILGPGVIPIFSLFGLSFDFSLVHNTGAAFGFLNDQPGWQHVFFVTLATVVSLVLIFMTKSLKSHERHLAIAYCLIVAGAIGNAIDRVVYQYVVDFIHFFYVDWHYPHFNIADISIFSGAALLISEAFGKPFLNHKIPVET